MTPAFTSSSLNRPMSASSFSLGIMPASLFRVAFTITMNRIVFSVGGKLLELACHGSPGHRPTVSRAGHGQIDIAVGQYMASARGATRMGLEYVKRATKQPETESGAAQRVAAEMLAAIESRGEEAVREYAATLDGWTGDIVVPRDAIERRTRDIPER